MSNTLAVRLSTLVTARMRTTFSTTMPAFAAAVIASLLPSLRPTLELSNRMLLSSSSDERDVRSDPSNDIRERLLSCRNDTPGSDCVNDELDIDRNGTFR
ncbi:hypothetical protein PsorP6_000076 [Peronosclerospora sorghi]|uniref:Uncharacterized protein n=1 Tax=Peronosclerospora sorghi TaxID=230839 RepID=A0ACC0WUX8_9STRA|nr:hypothetical protein PsorP6_000076 [Peronosclerospora sorghi]